MGGTGTTGFAVAGEAAAGGVVAFATFATFATVATFASAGALVDADLRTALTATPAARFGGLALVSAGVGVRAAAGSSTFDAFARDVGGRSAFAVAAVVAAGFGDFARGAGVTATAAAFFTATTATSAVSLSVLRGAGFFAVAGVTAGGFSGAGLRALLDGAFALTAGAFGAEAGVVKALEAVDFAVFFVVNL